MLTLPGSGGIFAVTPAGQSAVPISITMVQPSEPQTNQPATSTSPAVRLPPSAALAAKPQVLQINSPQSTMPSADQVPTGRPALRVVIPNSRGIAGGGDVGLALIIHFSTFILQLVCVKIGEKVHLYCFVLLRQQFSTFLVPRPLYFNYP